MTGPTLDHISGGIPTVVQVVFPYCKMVATKWSESWNHQISHETIHYHIDVELPAVV